NAVLVDQHQFAIGAQVAEDGAGGVADDAVDAGGSGAGLGEISAGAGRNGKSLPVDAGEVGTGTVLGGDQQLVGAGGAQRGLADDGAGAGGVGQGGGGHGAPG